MSTFSVNFVQDDTGRDEDVGKIGKKWKILFSVSFSFITNIFNILNIFRYDI